MINSCFFFFQAEDGIRDIGVTGVQTCALPISRPRRRSACRPKRPSPPSARRGSGSCPVARRRSPRPPCAGRGTSLPGGRDRKSGGEGKRGDLGGRRILKKKKDRQSKEYTSIIT